MRIDALRSALNLGGTAEKIFSPRGEISVLPSGLLIFTHKDVNKTERKQIK